LEENLENPGNQWKIFGNPGNPKLDENLGKSRKS
jgi:hypothetical protein